MDPVSQGGTGPMMTLAQVAAANPTATEERFYLRLGMGNSYNVSPDVGTVAWVDKATIGGVTYDFVVSPVHNVTKGIYYPTIQAAITAAADGDIINVAAGTYT